MSNPVPSFLRRPLMGLLLIAGIFLLLRVSTPEPGSLTFDAPVAPAGAGEPDPVVPLADRLLPVHQLAVCLDELAVRITVESSAAFEVFDHAYRDECRSPIAGDPQWRLAAEWFGMPFMPAVYGILDAERDLVVRAVQEDRAAGRPGLRAAALWRTALVTQASRLREFGRSSRARVRFAPSDPSTARPVR